MENTIPTSEGQKTVPQIFDRLMWGSYAANRDLGMKHEKLVEWGIGNLQMKLKYDGWQTMDSAPKSGITIEICYDSEGKETCLACWSDRPVCMLGSRNGGFPPGWATAGDECDKNLPLDPPVMWRNEI